MSTIIRSTSDQPTLDIESLSKRSLVELLLDEQTELSAVERFSESHEQLTAEPAQSKYYQALMPASQPSEHQQYAFEVDLDACSGCKSCVVACHTLNGLDEEEAWRSVGTLVDTEARTPAIQHVTTACHHCEDPGCLNGCPVKAYDKDPVTGIVKHLDDQCIGCKYCMLMCPYEVPRYSHRLGIVRKCDMCRQRLEQNEAPACVQSCPNEAIAIRLVEVQQEPCEPEERLVPSAPLSHITRPTTTFKTQSTERYLSPQDQLLLTPQESHWPLAAMLCLTQSSVGVIVAAGVLSVLDLVDVVWHLVLGLAALLAIAGLAIAPLHLGQPTRAWRVFLGIRTSWLSREAILFGAYSSLLLGSTAIGLSDEYWPSLQFPTWLFVVSLVGSIITGLAAIFTSGMIYVVTQREPWRAERTMTRFYLTAASFGATACCAIILFAERAPVTMAVVFAIQAAKAWYEWSILFGPARQADLPHDRNARAIVEQHFRELKGIRYLTAVAGLSLIAVAFLTPLPLAAILVSLSATVVLAGEICERLLYFASVSFDRMPGTLR